MDDQSGAAAGNALDAIARSIAACRSCELGAAASHSVPGEGPPDARLLLLGEAPGAQEDATGKPFCGPSGRLLTELLADAGIDRSECFVTSVLKHRPPQNRNPTPAERHACRPHLDAQIAALGPQVVVALGRVAFEALMEPSLGARELKLPLAALRERSDLRYRGTVVAVTYHPAAVLRSRRTLWRPFVDDLRRAHALTRT